MLKGEAVEEEIDGGLLASVIAKEQEPNHQTNGIGRKIVQGKLVFAR